MLDPFGIDYIITTAARTKANEDITEIAAEPSKTILSFLAEIASQKGLIMRHNERGAIVFDVYIPPASRGVISDGDLNVINVDSSFEGRTMHSSITTMGQSSLSREGEREATIENTLIPQNRPIIQQLNTVEDIDAQGAAIQVRNKELKSIYVNIELDKIDTLGDVVKAGDVITLNFPSIRIEQNTRFMVLSNVITVSATSEKSVLRMIMEEALTGNQPVKFW